MATKKSFEWDIFERRRQAFVLWTATDLTYPPFLILGQLITSIDPVRFDELVRQRLEPVADKPHLWQLEISKVKTKPGATLPDATLPDATLPDTTLPDIASPDGKVFHYWFEVRNRALKPRSDPGGLLSSDQPILVTDAFATAVDYRLQCESDGVKQPASVIKVLGSGLVPCDPSGDELASHNERVSDNIQVSNIPKNNELVIYELPASWTRAGTADMRDLGTFKDTLALLGGVTDDVVGVGPILSELKINAIELLPPTDSKTRGEWGYAPAHYFAPDYDLGGSKHNASTDFAALSDHCLRNNIRLINDTVMAFGHDPYIYIGFNTFHILPNHDKDKKSWNHNPDAWQSDRDNELRDGYGGKSWRFNPIVKTYDPEGGMESELVPARVFHRAHLAWWMSQYRLGGFRLDSINNIGNYDFVREFRSDAYKHFHQLYDTSGSHNDRFIIIGEELAMPIDMVKGPSKCVDSLWNERFQERLRAAIVGQGKDDDMYWTVRKMIDCTELRFWKNGKEQHLESGGQVINYITSHDTEGDRKQRLWNYLDDWGITQNADKAQRCKLAFACLLTSLGIPMIFAGEEFCDEGDNKFKHPYKQRDPVNWRRKPQKWRSGIFECVARLVELRKSHPALTNLKKGSVDFIHHDDSEGRQIFAWLRGTDPTNMVVVVANFSNQRPSVKKYKIKGWEILEQHRPTGMVWFNAITGKKALDAGEAPLEPWDVKVYDLRREPQSTSPDLQ